MATKKNLGTDHPFYQLMKISGGSILKLLGFNAEQADNYHFDAIVLKERHLEPDIQGLPILESETGRVFIEFQGYQDKFIRYRLLSETLHACVLNQYEKNVKIAIIYTESSYQQAALPFSQLSPEFHLNIQEIVLTDYSLAQLLAIDPKLIVLAPFTEASKADKYILQQQMQQWTKVLKQAYPAQQQQDALNLLGLFLLNRFRDFNYEEVIKMLHFNLLDTQAGRDVYQMGSREGLEKGLEKGLEEGLEKGLEEGLEKGLEEGLEKGKQFIVKQMLGKGLEVRDIAELTQLPESEIVKLCYQSEDNNKQ